MAIPFKEGKHYKRIDEGIYKYELLVDMTLKLPYKNLVLFPEDETFNNYWFGVNEDKITVKKGYRYDGLTSSPDFEEALRAAAWHDVGYQLMRKRLVPLSYRKHWDKLFYYIMKKDGMNYFLRKFIYRMVRLFGESSAKPSKNEPELLIYENL